MVPVNGKSDTFDAILTWNGIKPHDPQIRSGKSAADTLFCPVPAFPTIQGFATHESSTYGIVSNLCKQEDGSGVSGAVLRSSFFARRYCVGNNVCTAVQSNRLGRFAIGLSLKALPGV